MSRGGKPRGARFGVGGGVSRNMGLRGAAKAIREALDPSRAPKPVRTFAQMTKEERAAIVDKYLRRDKKK